MIDITKNKLMISIKTLILIILLPSCESSQCMKDYYNTNKNSLVAMRNLSEGITDNYTFNQVTIVNKDVGLELMFQAGDYDNVTMYLNPSDLSLISESAVDECSVEALTRFRAMYNDNALRQILQLSLDIDPKAILITNGSLFIGLGQPLESPNPSLSGGILMTFQPGVADNKIVETIDTNVYLYDTMVY